MAEIGEAPAAATTAAPATAESLKRSVHEDVKSAEEYSRSAAHTLTRLKAEREDVSAALKVGKKYQKSLTDACKYGVEFSESLVNLGERAESAEGNTGELGRALGDMARQLRQLTDKCAEVANTLQSSFLTPLGITAATWKKGTSRLKKEVAKDTASATKELDSLRKSAPKPVKKEAAEARERKESQHWDLVRDQSGVFVNLERNLVDKLAKEERNRLVRVLEATSHLVKKNVEMCASGAGLQQALRGVQPEPQAADQPLATPRAVSPSQPQTLLREVMMGAKNHRLPSNQALGDRCLVHRPVSLLLEEQGALMDLEQAETAPSAAATAATKAPAAATKAPAAATKAPAAATKTPAAAATGATKTPAAAATGATKTPAAAATGATKTPAADVEDESLRAAAAAVAEAKEEVAESVAVAVEAAAAKATTEAVADAAVDAAAAATDAAAAATDAAVDAADAAAEAAAEAAAAAAGAAAFEATAEPSNKAAPAEEASLVGSVKEPSATKKEAGEAVSDVDAAAAAAPEETKPVTIIAEPTADNV